MKVWGIGRVPNYMIRYLLILFLGGVIFFSWDHVWLLLGLPTPVGLQGELIGGMVTSMVIFLFFLLMKPTIEICPKIIKYSDGRFRIKVYNSSPFNIYEVRAFLTKVTPQRAAEGKQNVILTGIPITFKYLEVVPSMYNGRSRKEGSTFALLYDIVQPNENNEVKIFEDMEAVLNSENDLTYYRLTISCKNGFTGIRTIRTENFTHRSSVKPGEFKCGATFKLVD